MARIHGARPVASLKPGAGAVRVVGRRLSIHGVRPVASLRQYGYILVAVVVPPGRASPPLNAARR